MLIFHYRINKLMNTEHFVVLCDVYDLIWCDFLDSENVFLQPNGLSSLSLQEMSKALSYDAYKMLLGTLECICLSESLQYLNFKKIESYDTFFAHAT